MIDYIDKNGLEHFVQTLNNKLNAKMDKIDGSEGDVLTFDKTGNMISKSMDEVYKHPSYIQDVYNVDAEQVYQDTRPTDWMPMPDDDYVQDNEIYLLTNGNATSFSIYINNSSATIKIEHGVMNESGEFIPNEDDTKTGVTGSSGYYYNQTIISDSQLMIKVSIPANTSGYYITRFEPREYSNIIEIKARCTRCSQFDCSYCSNTSSYRSDNSTIYNRNYYPITGLRYFSLLGGNNITAYTTHMFYGCSSLITVRELDTSKATGFGCMFYGCSSLVTVPKFTTSKVTDMQYMFYGCILLLSIPDFDTTNVTDMSHMFYSCKSLATIPLLNTSSVTDMSQMFYECTSLITIPEIDFSKVTDISSMFYECLSLDTIPRLNTDKATKCQYLFYNCKSLKSVSLINLSQVTDISYLFYGCSSLTTIPELLCNLSTKMIYAFYNCSSLTSIPLLYLSAGNTGDMTETVSKNAFYNCTSLSSIIINSTKTFCSFTIDLRYSNLDYEALINLFNNFPIGNNSYKINSKLIITNNPGVKDLTDEDKSIMTEKYWTLVC